MNRLLVSARRLARNLASDADAWAPGRRRLRHAASLLSHPGVLAVFLLRIQDFWSDCGCRPASRIVSLLNLRLTGAEFDPGCRVGQSLLVKHPQGIVVGAGTVIGHRCVLTHGVTLGERDIAPGLSVHEYPILGNDVVVGTGATILGAVSVGDGARIGAHAVVLRDVGAGSTVVGVPAREIVPRPVRPSAGRRS